MALRIFACTTAAWFCSAAVYGHEDLDLGIKDIRFDPECRPIVVIQNTGERPLPATFYLAVNPAYLTVSKDAPNNRTKGQSQTSRSLRALDPHKKLLPVGGELEVRLDKPMVKNPAPLTAKLFVQGEFWEYNQKNDQLSVPIDCMPGQGTLPGIIVKPSHADLALEPAIVTARGCQVTIRIINLNHGALPVNAWSGADGIVLSIYDVQKEARLAPILLAQIDPGQKLINGEVYFNESRDPGLYRYSLWQVRDDPEFSNNHQEVDLRQCNRAE
ncbi:MAG TPA: hypothetical protein PK011_04730 [Marinagarivorans sp.]|nr:hypothetical protein [Cellvibrionaceae bacterium]HMY38611.1 hypothetical protein [Marinagarivorans sp.]HNG60561.1 hypothetical protein [Cellvibrionaceae bacterium]